MTNRTDNPAAHWLSDQLICDNRVTFETWRDRQISWRPLPVTDLRYEPEGVFVFLANTDDLADWFEVTGGVVERGPAFVGTRTWMLTVDLGPDCRGLIVRVSAQALADEQPLQALLDAERLAVSLARSPQAVSA